MNRKFALSVPLVLALPLGAQTSPGYSPQSAATERATEADVISRPSPTSASAHSRFLSFQPHMAGTPAQMRTRDYVVSQMKSWGLETEIHSYSVWMPHPVSTRVWRIAPNPNGDPSTPGYPSMAGAKRIPLSSMEVPHIPVLPISYGNAAELLGGLAGKTIPQPWQGGLAFRYH